MTLPERLRALVEAAPPDATVPVRWIAELLEEEANPPSRACGVDFTVEDVAAALGRAASTVRTWCHAGRIPGAYRLRGREWRIPPAGLETFRSVEQSGEGAAARVPGGRGRPADLSAWRKVRARAS